jgi:hypothetical protein
MAFGKAGEIMSIGRQLRMWNLVTGTSLDIPHSFQGALHRCCACSSNGRLAYNWDDSKVAVWGCDWTKEKQHLIDVGMVHILSFNENGLLMIVTSRAVQIWNCEDGSMIQNYVIPEGVTRLSGDLRYQSGFDTEFGVIDLKLEENEACQGASSQASKELPWCPRSLRLARTENSVWLMKGSKRVLWIPRESLTHRLFSVRTDLETGMSTVVMLNNGHIMILRISAED